MIVRPRHPDDKDEFNMSSAIQTVDVLDMERQPMVSRPSNRFDVDEDMFKPLDEVHEEMIEQETWLPYKVLLAFDCARFLARSKQQKLREKTLRTLSKEQIPYTKKLQANLYEAMHDRDNKQDLLDKRVRQRVDLHDALKNNHITQRAFEFELQQNNTKIKLAKRKLKDAELVLKSRSDNFAAYQLSLDTLETRDSDVLVEQAYKNLSKHLDQLDKLPSARREDELKKHKSTRRRISKHVNKTKKFNDKAEFINQMYDDTHADSDEEDDYLRSLDKQLGILGDSDSDSDSGVDDDEDMYAAISPSGFFSKDKPKEEEKEDKEEDNGIIPTENTT